jgi:CcmD family protein
MTRSRWFAIFFVSSLFFATVALAEPETPPTRATSFQAVSGSQKEQVPGGPMVIAAYAVLWVLVGGFVLRMGRSQRVLESEVAAMEKRLASLERPKA